MNETLDPSQANAEDDAHAAPLHTVPAEQLHEALDRVLTRTVVLATGIPDAEPREGQRLLAHDILSSMIGEPETDRWVRGHTAGAAPTGLGKSFSALSAAATISVLRGERVVISTNSLALQSQYLDKDAPVVVQAAEIELGRAPRVEPHKGWSNYVCGAQAAQAASEALNVPAVEHPRQLPGLLAVLDERSVGQSPVAGRRGRKTSIEPTMTLGGREVREHEALPLIRWALAQTIDSEHGDPVVGDKQSYDGIDPDGYWSLVSTSPDQCPGVDRCAFGSSCLPAAAKDRTAEADIIVTNHSMIAVQAALGVPVVLGSRKLGTFRHLVVDEAHTLAAAVRSQGARRIDAWRIQRIVKATVALLEPHPEDPQGKKVVAHNSEGLLVADALDTRLASIVTTSGDRSGIAKCGENDLPFDGLDDAILAWLKKTKRFYPDEQSLISMRDILALRRAVSLVDALADDIRGAANHADGVARWVERDDQRQHSRSAGRWTGAALNVSPVEISGKLRSNLYTAAVLPLDGEDYADVSPGAAKLGWALPPSQWVDPEDIDNPRHDLSVSMISATLPKGFCWELGLRTKLGAYPSPFDTAYGRSMLYIPRATSNNDIAALTSRPPRNGRHQLDTGKHPDWAVRIMDKLINANSGSALVLSATAKAGKYYTERLRAEFGHHWRVYSQWDGIPIGQITATWKDDHHAILVGTRSLMTGVDAPGQTNSLVIIDRVPRAAGNPVDDARRDLIAERQEIDTWSADRQVYVADAAMLAEQESGRLIRAVTDHGMVAVLDPRLLKSGTMSYPEATRAVYMDAFRRFERKTADLSIALAFLAGSAAQTQTSTPSASPAQ